MTEKFKRLQPKKDQLNFTQGFSFGMGFMTAVVVFSFVIVPMLACGALIVLSALGVSLGQ